MGTNQGFIILPRNTRDDPLYKDEPFTRWQALIDLVLAANHCEKSFLLGYEEVEVNAGDVVTSEQRLAERWKWSRDKVRRFLHFLERRGDIIRKADNRKTIIKIARYSDYQTIPHKDYSENSQTGNTTETLVDTEVEANQRTTEQTSIKLQTVQQTNSKPTANQQQTIHNELTMNSLSYSLHDQQQDSQWDSQGKSVSFTPPTLEQIEEYCRERNNNIDAQRFLDHYESIGWKVGKNQAPMQSWKATIRTWEKYQQNDHSQKDVPHMDDAIAAFLRNSEQKDSIFVPCQKVNGTHPKSDRQEK